MNDEMKRWHIFILSRHNEKKGDNLAMVYISQDRGSAEPCAFSSSRSLAPLTRSLVPYCSLRALAHSQSHGKVNGKRKKMSRKSTHKVLGYSLLHSLIRSHHCSLQSRTPLSSFIRSLAHSLSHSETHMGEWILSMK